MKTILISGVSGSIGRYLSDFFLQNGDFVIGISRKKDISASEFQSYRNIVCDITDEKQLIAEFKILRHEKIAIDAFIHCAGVSSASIATLINKETTNYVFDVNMIGSSVLLREVIKNMISNRNGAVVNMSSITASIRNNGSGIYASSKIAFEQFCKQMAIENARYGIRINSLQLPIIENTKMNSDISVATREEITEKTIQKRQIALSEIAILSKWLISNEATMITGETITPGGR